MWSLATGERVRSGLPAGLAATDGVRVVIADDTHVHVLDGEDFPHGLPSDEEESLEYVAILGDEVHVQSSNSALAVFSFGGQERQREAAAGWLPEPPGDPTAVCSEPGEPSCVAAAGQTWALPADGVLAVAGQRWAWSTEGALYALS